MNPHKQGIISWFTLRSVASDSCHIHFPLSNQPNTCAHMHTYNIFTHRGVHIFTHAHTQDRPRHTHEPRHTHILWIRESTVGATQEKLKIKSHHLDICHARLKVSTFKSALPLSGQRSIFPFILKSLPFSDSFKLASFYPWDQEENERCTKLYLKATLSAFPLKLNMVYDNSAESGVKNLGWER